MSPILLLSIILQVGCAVHVVRTGRPMYWLFILLIGSYIAVLIYLVAVVLPDMQNSRGARRVVRGLKDQIDPGRGRREADAQLAMSDSQDNRRKLAEQCLATGDFQKAAETYQSALRGLYANDPHLLIGLAQAQFGLGETAQTVRTIDSLIAANPGFHSYDAHLLYARALAASGETRRAREEYAELVTRFPGEEARARYGLLLKSDGDEAAARAVFQDILQRLQALPDYYRREQREWIDIAKRELG